LSKIVAKIFFSSVLGLKRHNFNGLDDDDYEENALELHNLQNHAGPIVRNNFQNFQVKIKSE